MAENVFRNKIDRQFTLVNLAGRVREDLGQIRLPVPGRGRGNILSGTVDADHFVEMIKSGSDTMQVRTRYGDVEIDACTALKQILEFHIDPGTWETIRRKWRKTEISDQNGNRKTRCGFGYGGIVMNGGVYTN